MDSAQLQALCKAAMLQSAAQQHVEVVCITSWSLPRQGMHDCQHGALPMCCEGSWQRASAAYIPFVGWGCGGVVSVRQSGFLV